MTEAYLSKMPKRTTGAVITAAGKSDGVDFISPLTQLGKISIIKRMILMLQSVHVFPIVVVTGYQYVDLEAHLANYGVVFVRNEDYVEDYSQFKSLQLGFEFLKDKCDNVLFTPVMIPMLKADTLTKMMAQEKDIVVPTFDGKEGNPVLVSQEVMKRMIEYPDRDSAYEGIREQGYEVTHLDVDDEGILPTKESIEHLDQLLEEHNAQLLHPFVKINIERENVLLDGRAKMLLLLIEETNSVQAACKQIAMSKAKAWDVINNMEKSLGFTVVSRRQGGSRGGKTELTEKGKEFLNTFMEYELLVRKFAQEQFRVMFDLD